MKFSHREIPVMKTGVPAMRTGVPCNENRVFPVKFSHREIPVMRTGVPAMRTGVPCNENRFFPVWKTSQGKPCSGPVLALYRIAVYILKVFY